MRVLIVTFPWKTHLFHLVPLAWSLRTAGHEVRVATEPDLLGAVTGAGLTADSLDTKCTISLEKGEGGFSITESHLELKAKIPGATQEAFDTAVRNAETGCPVSKLYKTNITVNAILEG